MKIHHVGYLVKDISTSKDVFMSLGYVLEQDVVRDELRKIDIAFLKKNGVRIELVAAYDKTSVVASLYKKIGNSPYHICYKSAPPLDMAVSAMEQKGFMLIAEPEIAPALNNRPVVFMYHPHIGMIEIVEEG